MLRVQTPHSAMQRLTISRSILLRSLLPSGYLNHRYAVHNDSPVHIALGSIDLIFLIDCPFQRLIPPALQSEHSITLFTSRQKQSHRQYFTNSNITDFPVVQRIHRMRLTQNTRSIRSLQVSPLAILSVAIF